MSTVNPEAAKEQNLAAAQAESPAEKPEPKEKAQKKKVSKARAKSSRPSLGILAALGLFGWEEVEPAILAALVTEEPLLLIGPHGTGKSMLLERLAEAMGLCFRHYNASLICFDDLIGFPVPERGSARLKYLQTPATIWDAEAVFFDEVSRCRPDVQNKLFSIIHERKVQGLRLEKLRYRWSAMNPPASASGSENYSGSYALDSALADRYAFVVQVPDWNALGAEAQMRVLAEAGSQPEEGARERLAALLKKAREKFDEARRQLEPLLAGYVRQVAALLQEGGVRLSPRRLVMLMRNIPAVHAVLAASAGGRVEAKESFRLALFCSIPSPAEGAPVPKGKLAAVHVEAWRNAARGTSVDLARILNETDPAMRAALAARSDSLDLQQRSTIIGDCMQGLPDGARHALAAWLVENDLAGRLVASVAEKVAEDYAMIAVPAQGYFSTYGHIQHAVGRKIAEKIAALENNGPGSQALAHLLASMFANNKLQSEAHVERVCEQWNATRETLLACGVPRR